MGVVVGNRGRVRLLRALIGTRLGLSASLRSMLPRSLGIRGWNGSAGGLLRTRDSFDVFMA